MIARPGDGQVQYLHLPVDERMETLCRHMIHRPEELWTIPPANYNPGWPVPDAEKVELVREHGVRCLRSFRSDANIAILKAIATERRDWPSRRVIPRFDAARVASETLRLWGVGR